MQAVIRQGREPKTSERLGVRKRDRMIKEEEWTDGDSFVALAQGAAVLGVGLLERKSTRSHQRTKYSALSLNMA